MSKSGCPTGWHFPTDEEWKTIESYLGMSDEDVDMGGNRQSGDVGKKLKSTSKWYDDGILKCQQLVSHKCLRL